MSNFYTLLSDTNTFLRYLNSNQTPFMAMVSVPGMHKLKLLYGIGYVTTGIRQGFPIANKFLALFGKGSATMGPEQVIMLDYSICTHI